MTGWSKQVVVMAMLAMSQVGALAEEAAAKGIGDSFIEAITGGKVDFYARYRFEYANDGAPGKKDAYANTLRSALGYNTGLFYDFGGYIQLEDVRVLGDDLFNDGGSNNVTDRAVVVDPEGTELNQANIRYEGIPGTVLRAGRQDIQHRQAPMHRYIGNILWRQNWQTFDAFRVVNKSLPDTTLDYTYAWNANRIFGEDNKLPDRSDFRMNSHFLNALYTGFPLGKIEPYVYLLEMNTATANRFSTQTYGMRFDGFYWLNDKAKLLYTAEAAYQSDYGNNATAIDVGYYLGELGGSYAVGGLLESVSVVGSIEVLQGDGGVKAFQTPLGTNHAFQGWADRFLVTPGDGIKDLFVTVKASVWGANLQAIYHDFASDKDNYDYGTEWDFIVEKPFAKYFMVGLKYSAYEADRNALNVERNSASTTGQQAFDLDRFWAYVQFKF